MKKTFRNSFFIGTTLFIAFFVFVVGFLIGNSGTPVWAMSQSIHASEDVDFSEFWKVWNLIDEKYVGTSTGEISKEARIRGAISGMVAAVDDPYTVYLVEDAKQDLEESISGNFQGVGMEIGIVDDLITVIAPLKNTPAERAGVKAGDSILKVDDTSVVNATVDDAVGLIRGPKGTVVNITVSRENVAEPFVISITRDEIRIPTLETKIIEDDIFVIELYNFSANAKQRFREALREFLLSDSDKLILDLRGNPGGYLDAAVDISSWFLPAGRTVVKEDFGNGNVKVLRSKGYNIFNDDLKMVILTNQGSASASEIVAGALKEQGVATVVGTPTFGKGSVQELIDLTNDSSLKVTIARWLTPNGTSISDGGLQPDYLIELTEDDFNAGIDPQLEKAIELLTQ